MITNHIKCTEPTSDNKYYISQSNGGYSLNQRKDSKTGSVLPNCTGYANGKFSEEYQALNGEAPHDCFRYFIYEAENFWWQVNSPEGHYYGMFKTGNKPFPGALMVWSDSKKHNGHVAIVDEVISDNEVIVCESSASGARYTREKINNNNGRWSYGGAYSFLGFIYNPMVKEITKPKPVAKDNSKNQVEIIKNTLRIRTDSSMQGDIIGLLDRGFYDFSEIRIVDGYTWYKLGDYNWCAGVSGTLIPHYSLTKGDAVMLDKSVKVSIFYRKFAYKTEWEILNIDGEKATIRNTVHKLFKLKLATQYLIK